MQEQAELLRQHKIKTPRTLIVHRDNRDRVLAPVARPGAPLLGDRARDAILERPAVKRALEVLKDARRAGEMTQEQKEVLFGATQYARR